MDDKSNAIKKRGPDDRIWYVVAHAMGMTDAEIPAGLLRSAGIPVFLFREAGSTVIPVSVGLLGGVQVAVPEEYYADAIALLEADNVFDEDDFDDEDSDTPRDELPDETGIPGEGTDEIPGEQS